MTKVKEKVLTGAASWLSGQDQERLKESNYERPELTDKELKLIEKLQSEIPKDTKKLLEKITKLFELSPQKETYDHLITVSMVRFN